MKIISIAVSKKKGTPKRTVAQAVVVDGHGLEGDGHAGPGHRQVSLLSAESIEAARKQGLNVGFGDFAENIATRGVDWKKVPVGTRLRLGKDVLLEVTQIGKACHNRCAIYYRAGDCIMPREGIFARVIRGGVLHPGDPIAIAQEA